MRRPIFLAVLLGMVIGFLVGSCSRDRVPGSVRRVGAAAHDPCRDPRPGDVVAAPDGHTRAVEVVLSDGWIAYRDEHGGRHHCVLRTWRRWTRERGTKGVF